MTMLSTLMISTSAVATTSSSPIMDEDEQTLTSLSSPERIEKLGCKSTPSPSVVEIIELESDNEIDAVTTEPKYLDKFERRQRRTNELSVLLKGLDQTLKEAWEDFSKSSEEEKAKKGDNDDEEEEKEDEVKKLDAHDSSRDLVPRRGRKAKNAKKADVVKRKRGRQRKDESTTDKDTCGLFDKCKVSLDMDLVEWVQCDDCSQWWHMMCKFGNNVPYTEETFVCCKSKNVFAKKRARNAW